MSVPEPQRVFLEQIISQLKKDDRLLGVAIGGSYLSGQMDEYSDLDLIIIVADDSYQQVLDERKLFANRLGSLLAAFTGEHVGEPRLLICLYENPLLHVDLKFLVLQDLKIGRVENPIVLWEQDNLLTLAIKDNPGNYPPLDLQWIEDRFWVWVHYGATKLGRGELFEAIDFLSYIRGQVLGPLAKIQSGKLPRGVRNLETELPHLLADFHQTIPMKHNSLEIAKALQHSIYLYRQFRQALNKPDLIVHSSAEKASIEYLQIVIDGLKY
ncbi:MAG: nucleotidyltransferase domain-containing protein [Nostoc sp. ChiSLP02]|nr:nucleotidyltransferase domain-containing protein [Nostoc sp. DedSLP05]MDZ8102750.1 nucleotidyltransferase domain-containing protein [Nostoc sp. DedSLP01]MDZ8186981.1 nucleotidyltransferase domain-containing protein [Nostoc sp. ChiSLP02]